ncbi:MAG: hypothetical protein WB439_02085 [Acidobacteriaceae bacterium]
MISIPLALSFAAWWTESRRRDSVGKVRSISFRVGLAAAVIGSIFLVVLSLDALLNHNGMVGDGFAARALWLPAAVLAVCALSLSFLGSKSPRVFGIISSLSLLVMLYLVGLATSY